MSVPPLPHPDLPEPEPSEVGSELTFSLPPGESDGTDLFLNPTAEPTDDTPTIISRALNKTPTRNGSDSSANRAGATDAAILAARTNDVNLAGSLRGRTLAHFELVEPVGVGGMAAVIRARDLQLDRPVALKILPPEMAADPENVARFHREARAAAKLDHENIARVFFCGEDQRLHFIAFEFVEGMNLRTLLERRGRLPVGEAVHYMLQIATGLAHAAERGVVHRDIKPSNIIISSNGRAKLVDMGLARSIEPHDGGLTHSGVTLGTFDYISPEQALEPREADFRSDIYSLGCTFYHALTGVPPVPEGTAAKKLHHHQHVAPVDPRVLNPEISDEVAAVLARMMAKDCKKRYQRPEHLVQHLMAIAQRIGTGADSPMNSPAGVLFMDAPLPSPPQTRPALLAVLAACGLLALILLLGQTDGRAPWSQLPDPITTRLAGESPPRKARNVNEGPEQFPTEGVGKLEPVDPKHGVGGTAETKTLTYDADVPQPRALAEFLRQNTNARVLLASDLNLTEDAASAVPLVFAGESLLIQPRDSQTRPTIRLALPSSARPAQEVLAALTVRKGTVTIRGLRFVLDAMQAPETAMAALFRQGGKVYVENCEFIQTRPSPTGRHSSAEVAGQTFAGVPDAAADVTFVRCLFLGVENVRELTGVVPGGQRAVTIAGSAAVRMEDCAFGPHQTLIAFRDDRSGTTAEGRERTGRTGGGRVTMERCSAMLSGDTVVFSLRGAPSCGVNVSRSLFSAVGDPFDQAVLVRQEDDVSSGFVFRGEDNRYHALTNFWQRQQAPEELIASLEDFQAETRRNSGHDLNSRVLHNSPWTADEPLNLLERAIASNLREAFQVNDQTPDLRQVNSSSRLIGVERGPWGGSYLLGLPPLPDEVVRPPVTVAGNKRIVDPDPKVRTGDGVYNTLAAAIADARPRDEILIRANGPVAIEPVRLVKSGLDLTIRPYPGSKPVLTLGAAPDPDAFLFQTHSGMLRLENLHFLLAPRADFRSQTIVALAGEGECRFHRCTITLDSPEDVPLSVLRLTDPSQMMKMDGGPPKSPSPPRIVFEDVVIRGDGDVVNVRLSRALDLEAKNTLAAVTGSFLNMSARDETAPTGGSVGLVLDRCTVHVGEHLLRFRTSASDTRGFVPVLCRAYDCLFLAAENRSLVHLDGPETNAEKMKTLLTWNGSHNGYAGYMKMLDQTPNDNSMALPPVEQMEWTRFTGETDAVFKGVKLSMPPDGPLSRVTPNQFATRVDANLSGPYGADPDSLPTPPTRPEEMRKEE